MPAPTRSTSAARQVARRRRSSPAAPRRANVVNVSSTAALTSGNLDSIAGTLVIVGESAADTVNAYDADAHHSHRIRQRHAALGPRDAREQRHRRRHLLQRAGAAESLLGQRADTTNVRGTAAGTVTTIFTGSGSANVVNVCSDAPASLRRTRRPGRPARRQRAVRERHRQRERQERERPLDRLPDGNANLGLRHAGQQRDRRRHHLQRHRRSPDPSRREGRHGQRAQDERHDGHDDRDRCGSCDQHDQRRQLRRPCTRSPASSSSSASRAATCSTWTTAATPPATRAH